MKPVLYRNPHIEIRLSPIHRYGVFATDDIKVNSILEETPFIYIPCEVSKDYSFAYPRGGTPVEETVNIEQGCVLPFGWACIYNHGEFANASWRTDTKNGLFVFFAQRDIKKDEEILTYYGPNSYWEERPNVKKV